jgi:hypothetical protein
MTSLIRMGPVGCDEVALVVESEALSDVGSVPSRGSRPVSGVHPSMTKITACPPERRVL